MNMRAHKKQLIEWILPVSYTHLDVYKRQGYYGVGDERYVVGEGDFLALGHHRLRFSLIPMVHWPETMVTFDETEGILFSGL